MALYKYLARKDGSIFPTVDMCEDSSLSRKEIEGANEGVKRVLGPANHKNKKKVEPCGKYNDYSSEERMQIGKYAAENGPTKAATHFSQLFERRVLESTMRRLKCEYLQNFRAIA